MPNSQNPLIIILLGKSGSGKGSQAELLCKKLGFEYIGSGDLLRERARIDDFVGNKIVQLFKTGDLFPTPVIFKLWLDRVGELKKKKNLKGVVLDGNPRKISEAYLIEETLQFFEWDKNIKSFLIDISDKEATRRILSRRVCEGCKKNFIFTEKSNENDRCPDCGGKLISRSDDSPESVKKRLQWFRSHVYPIINHYEKKGQLIRVNGEQSIEGVFDDIKKSLAQES